MLIRSRVRVRLLSGWLVVIRTVFILLSAVAACTAPVYVRGQLTSKLYRKQWLSADAWCGGKDHRHSPEIDTSHTRWSFEPRVSSSLSRAAAARLFYFSATDYSTPNVIFRLFFAAPAPSRLPTLCGVFLSAAWFCRRPINVHSGSNWYTPPGHLPAGPVGPPARWAAM